LDFDIDCGRFLDFADDDMEKFASIFLAGLLPSMGEDDPFLGDFSPPLDVFPTPNYGDSLFDTADPYWSTTMAADSQNEWTQIPSESRIILIFIKL